MKRESVVTSYVYQVAVSERSITLPCMYVTPRKSTNSKAMYRKLKPILVAFITVNISTAIPHVWDVISTNPVSKVDCWSPKAL